MSTELPSDDRFDASLVQFRFVGGRADQHAIEAEDFSDCLRGLVDLAKVLESEGALGRNAKSELLVDPVRPGSLIVDIWAAVTSGQPDLWGSLDLWGAVVDGGVAGFIGLAIETGRRMFRDEVDDFDYLDNGNVKLTFRHGPPTEVPSGVWDALNRNRSKTRRALRRLMSTMDKSDSGGADVLEVRTGAPGASSEDVSTGPARITMTQRDYEAVEDPDDDDSSLPDPTEFTVDVAVDVVDFREQGDWRIRLRGESGRKATMADTAFQSQLDRGELAISKDDVLNVTIEEQIVPREQRIRRDWRIIRVNEVKGRRRDDNPDAPQDRATTQD